MRKSLAFQEPRVDGERGIVGYGWRHAYVTRQAPTVDDEKKGRGQLDYN